MLNQDLDWININKFNFGLNLHKSAMLVSVKLTISKVKIKLYRNFVNFIDYNCFSNLLNLIFRKLNFIYFTLV